MKESFITSTGFFNDELAHVLDSVWFLIPNWKWIGLALVFILGLLLKPLFRVIVRKTRRLTRQRLESRGFLPRLFELHLEVEFSWILTALFWIAGIQNLQLPAGMEKYLAGGAQLLLSISIIMLVYKSISAVGDIFQDLATHQPGGVDQQIITFVVRSLQVMVIVLGILITLQGFGVNVVSVLAGLGLGGLALALAAQDTAANVFGSITILMDRPFRIGDNIKVAGVEGKVESIGFRSTRLRTAANSLVSIPNSTIAKEQVDNLELRPRRRVAQTLGLLYETPPEKIVEFVDKITDFLKGHNLVSSQGLNVGFRNFGASTLDVQVNFHLDDTHSLEKEFAVTQDIFCEFLKIASQVGVEYAYPTQTLYVKKTGEPENTGQ